MINILLTCTLDRELMIISFLLISFPGWCTLGLS